jgi:anti-sigma B factor antagonist
MEMTIEKVGEVAVVELRGEQLDASNVAHFKRDIAPVLEGNSRVVLDLSQLRFVDSSGLGAILSCLRRLNGAGGS